MLKTIDGDSKPQAVEVEFLLKQLIHKVEEQGYLVTDDLLAVIPETEENIAALDEVLTLLADRQIEIYRNEAEANSKRLVDTAHRADDKVVNDSELFDLTPIPADDIVTLYLKELSWVPLLTSVEEITLAKQIEKGRQAEKMLQDVSNDPDKRIVLQAHVEVSRQARDHLICANTRLVVSVAKKYMGYNVPFSDLIQAGNLGLMRAVEKFDYRQGYKFCTYATWWVRQAVTRVLADQGRTIRVPVHMSDRIRRLYQTQQQLEQTWGRKPTPEELAQELGLKSTVVEWMLRVGQQPISLDQPMGEDGNDQLSNRIEDETVPPTPDSAALNLLREKLDDILATLTPREAKIIRLRFGFQNGQSYTLQEVGSMFGLTRERIRQVEAKALRKLRHPRCTRQIRDFLE